MSSNTSNSSAIAARLLSKSYFIQTAQRPTTLAEALFLKLVHPFKRPATEVLEALKDVSFEVPRGKVMGVIGRNGAGKSTLLKILSRITPPSKGEVEIDGRVGSLLEVGMGFHPELTGRENIYLNGTILGMKRREIDKKFDAIVAFAELEKFLETPVKRYSSGMYVRLGFAIAAHLEPEILLVDEVLAVGDLAFQRKCLGKMENVAKEGRTILFVSHNMAAVTQLCHQAIYLEGGKVVCQGPTEEVVSKYLASMSVPCGQKDLAGQGAAKKVFFKKATLLNHDKAPTHELDVRYPFYLELEYEVASAVPALELSVRVDGEDGRPILTTLRSDSLADGPAAEAAGAHKTRLEFPGMFFMPGSYFLTIAAHQPMAEIYDLREHVFKFSILETGTRLSKYQNYASIGVVMRDIPWVDANR
jgi:lipopolysaccharide transport system ATP-binding protein